MDGGVSCGGSGGSGGLGSSGGSGASSAWRDGPGSDAPEGESSDLSGVASGSARYFYVSIDLQIKYTSPEPYFQ